MQRFYIIADDLTGANDSGVQLSKMGIASTVLLDCNDDRTLQSIQDVAIIDTDSRALSEEYAFKNVYLSSFKCYEQGFTQVYKKIDSTLRGNIAAELSAIARVHKPEIVVVAPAYPKMDRLTINGHQYVHGHLVSESEFGKDPKTPVTNSYIPAILGKLVKDPIILLNHDLLQGSTEEIKNFISTQSQQGSTWFVCDAKTDADLKKIATAFGKVNKKTIWAGSAGLIEYLPDVLDLEKKATNQEKDILVNKTLTVSGSMSSTTKQQIEYIKHLADSYLIELDPVDLIDRTYCIKEIVNEIKRMQFKKHFVLFVDPSAKNRKATKEIGFRRSLNKKEIGAIISTELGKIAKEIVSAFHDINGLILTGGDTAKAVCNQLNMFQIALYSEIEPGLPLGKLSNAVQNVWAITKAGGFGNKYSLVNALKYMVGDVKEYGY